MYLVLITVLCPAKRDRICILLYDMFMKQFIRKYYSPNLLMKVHTIYFLLFLISAVYISLFISSTVNLFHCLPLLLFISSTVCLFYCLSFLLFSPSVIYRSAKFYNPLINTIFK